MALATSNLLAHFCHPSCVQGWKAVNNPGIDKSLTFSTTNLSQLQQRMEVHEQATTPLLFDASCMSWATYLPMVFKAVFCKAGFDRRP